MKNTPISEASALAVDGITLLPSRQSVRLMAEMQHLIISTYERCTNRPGICLRLTRLEFVSAENNAGKYSTRLNALVREVGQNFDAIPVRLTITAELNIEEFE